ncbi:MAG: glucose-6-phosphate dehydrogenase [Actinomycetota bacterium]
MTLQRPTPQAIVLFGASGDLAHKKIIPALYNLCASGLLPESHAIVGFARAAWDDDGFRAHAREAVQEHSHSGIDEAVWKRFADSLMYVPDPDPNDDSASMRALSERLRHADEEHGTESTRLFYLAVPPEAFLPIVEGLAAAKLNSPTSRLVVEKPFGDSLGSARHLTSQIHKHFSESQVFRIDHYLGKETVQNLVVFRFANSLWERVWNRDAIDSVQLTVAESIGVEGRAGYYEHAGATRDLLQNHMLQVLAFLCMEPPRALEAEAFRDEKTKLLKTVRPIEPSEAMRGQYDGYRREDGVAPDSQTETYIAARVWIDNWRWEGVPFYLRHGKELPARDTEITVTFRQAPEYLFRELELGHIPSNHLTIRIQPNEGMSLAFQAKVPGPGYELQTVRMDFDYEGSFMHEPAEAYERLLHDAMCGDHTLFTRADAVERAWEIVTPLLEHPGTLYPYEAGTWGPKEADELIAPRTWHLRDRSQG